MPSDEEKPDRSLKCDEEQVERHGLQTDQMNSPENRVADAGRLTHRRLAELEIPPSTGERRRLGGEYRGDDPKHADQLANTSATQGEHWPGISARRDMGRASSKGSSKHRSG